MSLADDVCKDGMRDFHPRDMQPVLARIKQAQKYLLAPQFAAVSDELAQSFSSLVKAFPFCRLPYREVWIEVTHTDRPLFAGSDIHAPRYQLRPRRVGYLLSATRDDLSAWKTHLFWNFDKGSCHCATVAMTLDMVRSLHKQAVIYNRNSLRDAYSPEIFDREISVHPGWSNSSVSVQDAMTEHVEVSMADYGLPLAAMSTLPNSNKIAEGMLQLARSDWAGEVPYLMAVIGLMNTRNVVETVRSDHTKINKARVRSGKVPLLEYHTLKINTRVQKRIGGEQQQGGHHATMRGHFVAGHFKVRKTGIFFWKPFSRGDFAKGAIAKDYLVGA